MVARLLLVAVLSAALPLTYLFSSSQQAAAFSSASDVTLENNCTENSGFYTPALSVPVNNSNTKLVISTLGGVSLSNLGMEAVLRLPDGSTIVDRTDIVSQNTNDREAASLTWTGTSSGTYEVLFRSWSGSTVCLFTGNSDLRVIY